VPRAGPATLVRRLRTSGLLLVLGLALLGAMVAGVVWGAVPVPPGTVVAVVARHLGASWLVGQLGLPAEWPAAQEAVVWQLRLPRVLAGALVGAALATSGALFQGLFRNPMADPYVLGISSGAALGATLVLAVPALPLLGAAPADPGAFWTALTGYGLVPLAAFAGAIGAATLVYQLARRGQYLPITDLLLAGFAVAAVLGAATTVLLVMNDRLLLRLRAVFSWMAGGIAVGSWGQLALAAPLIGVGLLLAWLLGRWLDAFLLGEEGAATVGVPVEWTKRCVVLVAALLTAAAVTLSGLVGFVGLLVPHAIRLVVGPSHQHLLPAAALGGAVFLVLADLLARTILAPVELPVGVLTALVGGPAFLLLLRRSRRRP
jgi:iron complex transport system permease protein